jgi:hypothetical protein
MYCDICESCGDENCCPPTRCKQNNNGKYCENYLNILKNTYKLHVKLINEIYTDENLYKNLITLIENYE